MMNTSVVFERPLSMADLGYVSFGYRATDLDQDISHCIVEGEGIISNEALQNAINSVAQALPSCRAVLRGNAGARIWRADGPLPAIRTIHREWDGQYREDLDFLERSFDLCHGPIAEIIQVVSKKTFLVFRSHHAVLDGLSHAEFVKSVFKALRHEPLENFHSNYVLENLVAAKIRSKRPTPPVKAVNPLGNRDSPATKRPRQREWRRISVNISGKMALPVLAVELARLTRETENGPVRFSIPVSLRRHLPAERTAANLVGILKVDIDENETARSFVKKINDMLREELDLPSESEIKGHQLFKALPLPLLRLIGKMILFLVFRSKFFTTSGILSSLGTTPLAQLSCDSFKAHTFFGISISPTGSPLFAAISSHENATEITLSATRQMAAGDKLLRLANKLQARLATHR